MASYSVILAITCSFCLIYSESVINFQRFHRFPALQQTVCNSDDVLFSVSTATDIACSAVCAQTTSCRSYMYNIGTKNCIGCSKKYTANSEMGSSAGYEYYENTTCESPSGE